VTLRFCPAAAAAAARTSIIVRAAMQASNTVDFRLAKMETPSFRAMRHDLLSIQQWDACQFISYFFVVCMASSDETLARSAISS
jgi:hypothetical protein